MCNIITPPKEKIEEIERAQRNLAILLNRFDEVLKENEIEIKASAKNILTNIGCIGCSHWHAEIAEFEDNLIEVQSSLERIKTLALERIKVFHSEKKKEPVSLYRLYKQTKDIV